MELHEIPTCELVKELIVRDGVTARELAPYETYMMSGEGPTILMIIED